MSDCIEVLRHPNRKMTLLGKGFYVNIDWLLGQMKTGATLRVVHKKTGEDLTGQMYAQLVARLAAQGDLTDDELLGVIRTGLSEQV